MLFTSRWVVEPPWLFRLLAYSCDPPFMIRHAAVEPFGSSACWHTPVICLFAIFKLSRWSSRSLALPPVGTAVACSHDLAIMCCGFVLGSSACWHNPVVCLSPADLRHHAAVELVLAPPPAGTPSGLPVHDLVIMLRSVALCPPVGTPAVCLFMILAIMLRSSCSGSSACYLPWFGLFMIRYHVLSSCSCSSACWHTPVVCPSPISNTLRSSCSGSSACYTPCGLPVTDQHHGRAVLVLLRLLAYSAGSP
jgi:hypothetical protein